MTVERPVFVDPMAIFNGTDFAPFSGESYASKINSTFRFVAIAAILLWLRSFDQYMFAIGIGFVLASVFWPSSSWPPLPASRPARDRSYSGRDACAEKFEGAGRERREVSALPCQEPTKENPFANVMLTDYSDNPDRPGACDPGKASELIDDAFYEGLPRDSDDIYETGNSRRQFYTMPNTKIPNDQTAFARLCMGDSGKRKSLGQRYYSP